MSPSSSRIRNIFEPLDLSYVADLWDSRFGISLSVFSGYLFFRKAQSVWAINDNCLPRISYEATTSALQVFGRHATKNVIHLDSINAMIFLEGKTQVIESNSEPGYVVVFYRGEVLGCGLYSHGKLVSQIPKERRMASVEENGACEDQ